MASTNETLEVNRVCPADATLLAFDRGVLTVEDLERISTHLSQCESCSDQLERLDSKPDELLNALRFSRTPSAESRPGDCLGEYEIIGLIGHGGMACVWHARHRRMNREVAIKMIAGVGASLGERFQREVEALAALSHPNIALAFDAGQHNGKPYLVMEYLRGRDLNQRLMDDGPLTASEACDAILQAARGLQYAHQQGLVHRDVKPANLFQMDDGTIKVLDLGLVRQTDQVELPAEVSAATSRDQQLTSATTIMGTLNYAAPEQMASAATTDHRADTYSLGCTLYALLTGKSPFARATAQETMQAHRDDAPPRINNVPARVANLAARMVSKSPEHRPSMAEVVAALEPKAKSWRWLVAAAVLVFTAGMAFALSRPPRTVMTASPAIVLPASGTLAPPTRTLPPMLTKTLTAKEAQAFQFQWASEAGVPVVEINQLQQSMTLIPPGVIAEQKLSMAQPLWASETETTVREFRAFVEATNYVPECSRAAGGGRMPLLKMGMLGKAFEPSKNYTWDQPGFPPPYNPNSPVVQVTWHDASAFCEWLSTKEKCRYRLPTWDEHCWMSRCGIASRFHFGNDWKDGTPYENSFLTQRAPSIVRLRKPNPWGLQDMLGNVKEWTSDWSTTAQRTRKVASGSYVESFEEMAKWSDWDPHVGAGHIGFRVVKEFTPP